MASPKAMKPSLIPLIFSFISFLLILLILLTGISSKVLTNNSFLKTDTSNLYIPSKLSNSTFLRDLSTVAGNDLVGNDASASSLGLSRTYSISLLTSCAQSDGSTICGGQRLGFQFNPEIDLKLDSTSLQGALPQSYHDQLSSYGRVSMFLAVAYILSAILAGVVCITTLLSARIPKIAIISLAESLLATATLFAASIAAIVTFSKLKDAFNLALGVAGLQTTTGVGLHVLSFLAFATSLGATVSLALQPRQAQQAKASYITSGFDAKPSPPRSSPAFANVAPRPGLIGRVSSWGQQHRYRQIDEQSGARAHGYESDRETLVASVMDTRSEYSHGPEFGHKQQGAIPLRQMGDKKFGGSNTAYDPYSHQGLGAAY